MGPQTIISEDGCVFTEFLGCTGAAQLWGGRAHLGQWAHSSKHILSAPLMPQLVNN